MGITKEQWQVIEKDLTRIGKEIQFNLNGDNIKCIKLQITESKIQTVVFVNDKAAKACKVGSNDLSETQILVSRKSSRFKYSQKQVKDSIKKHGKRNILKAHPDAFDKVDYLVPFFGTAQSLVNQFKKIEGLELITELEVAV